MKYQIKNEINQIITVNTDQEGINALKKNGWTLIKRVIE